MSKRVVLRSLKSAIARQKELHKKNFDQLRSESILSEENAGRIKALVKGIPKDKPSKDPLEYNPDMKHFTGSINGQKIEEPMKEKDLYDHLTSKGVKDKDATELILRLKAPYENKEKIDKLLLTAKKFGDKAKKESENRKRVKGKFLALTDKQKERQEKCYAIKKQHENNARKMGHDPKHPLWAKPSDPLTTIRNANMKAAEKPKPKAKTKTESVMEALSGAEIVSKYRAKGQSDLSGAVNKPRGTISSTHKGPRLSGAEIANRYAAKSQKAKPVAKSSKPVSTTSSSETKTSSETKPVKTKAPKATPKKVGMFRSIAGAVAAHTVSRAFKSAGPVGSIIGAHLGVKLANKIRGR